MAESPAKRPKIADPDLKIVVDDGELDVHSLLLQLASPVFASMLNSEMQEGMTNSISLPGKTKGELEMFYKSLQVSTEEALTPEIATCLVKWADEYQIENLKTKCEQFLLSQPVNAQGLQLAVKYGLSKRTTQCLNQFKEDLVKHVDDIVVLTGREGEEYMKDLWPLIIRKAGLDLPLPEMEHLPVIWPFLSAAVKGKAGSEQLATLQADSRRLQTLKTNVKTWPDQISNELNGAAGTYRLRARTWMLRTLHAHGFYDVFSCMDGCDEVFCSEACRSWALSESSHALLCAARMEPQGFAALQSLEQLADEADQEHLLLLAHAVAQMILARRLV
eukprot:symbB.v1.2.011653.t6/scaffold789.1/size230748/14